MSLLALCCALAAAQASDVSQVVYEHNVQRLRIERRTNVVLAGWGATSVVAGAVGAFALDAEPRAFAQMTVAWGAIDLLIGVVGLRNLRHADPGSHPLGDTLRRDAALERVFWINGGADVAYIALGGLLFLHGRNTADATLVGWGAAIVLQGWFLLAFDVANAMTHGRNHRALLLHPVIQEHLGVGMTAEF